MKNKIVKIISLLIIFIIIENIVYAATSELIINDETFSFNKKDEDVFLNFDNNYSVENDNEENNQDFEQEIKELTKKTTYLLLGEPNSQKDSSEEYFKRHKDYLNLRYNPEIPKDPNSYADLDKNSQEYKDDILSGLSVPGMFLQLEELDVKYNSYGEIRISVINENYVISSITLDDVNMKEQNSNSPMEYNRINTNLTLYYFFKKLNGEFKLLYLYGETSEDIIDYFNNNNEEKGELSENYDYESQLRDIYDFSKADAISDETINNIYEANKSKIVFFTSMYDLGAVSSANGIVIRPGLILTTYNYIIESLMKAQTILISDSDGNNYNLDGIVTLNKEDDVAILKVAEQNENYIEIKDADKINQEEAVITINSKTGVGLTSSKGIITVVNKEIQTSLPLTEEMQGSPIFNSDGELIGMLNSKILNTGISYATSINRIKEYSNKLANINYDDIKATSFEELKENYYIRYHDEKVVNTIPENKWNEYNQIENINDYITLDLVKGSYEDGIISLRYENKAEKYLNTMDIAAIYGANLLDRNYVKNKVSDNKIIYTSENYQIIIMSEFNYLIVIMMKI